MKYCVPDTGSVPVLAIYFTFVGLEILGILVCIAIIINGSVGLVTFQEDLPLETRKGIFLVDYIFSIITTLLTLGMLCGSALALVVYVVIVTFVNTTPGIETLMAFFGISILPVISLIVIKGAIMFVYLMIFVISIVAAVSNRRHKHRTDV